ncbi:nitroreductase family protein [Chloroflexota bacterium]
MQIDDFLELARNRRSIRKFKPDPVPDEYVEKMLEAARWSMSGANGQPWEFIVVKNRETIQELAEIYRRTISSLTWEMELTRLEEYRQPRFRVKGSPEEVKEAIKGRLAEWADAPLLIVLLGDRRTAQASTLAGRFFDSHVFDKNVANAAHMICLAAAAQGLGAQWSSVWETYDEEFKPILGIPPVHTVAVLIPIGFPAISPTPYRRELSEMVHYEKYDMSKYRSNSDIREFIKYQRQRHMDGGTYTIETPK